VKQFLSHSLGVCLRVLGVLAVPTAVFGIKKADRRFAMKYQPYRHKDPEARDKLEEIAKT